MNALPDHCADAEIDANVHFQRTFNYCNGAFLQSATNPENGTAAYTYNTTNNKVATKTDAKGQQVRYTYDSLARLTEVHRFNSSSVEDTCQKEIYSYDTNPDDGSYSQYIAGRLAAVQYMGGGGSGGWGTCGTTFKEMYNYNQAGARIGKRLRIERQMGRSAPYYDIVPVTQDLDSTYAYDNEGRMTSQQYPLSGPNRGYANDTMGRLNTMTDLGVNAPQDTEANTQQQHRKDFRTKPRADRHQRHQESCPRARDRQPRFRLRDPKIEGTSPRRARYTRCSSPRVQSPLTQAGKTQRSTNDDLRRELPYECTNSNSGEEPRS